MTSRGSVDHCVLHCLILCARPEMLTAVLGRPRILRTGRTLLVLAECMRPSLLPVQISDKIDPNDLVSMIAAFNPDNTPGRLAVVVRMGAAKVRTHLPRLVQAVQRSGQVSSPGRSLPDQSRITLDGRWSPAFRFYTCPHISRPISQGLDHDPLLFGPFNLSCAQSLRAMCCERPQAATRPQFAGPTFGLCAPSGPALAHPRATLQVVTWICDPMHGNTECVNNYKTRRYENIRAEVEAFFDVHDECGECCPAHHLAETLSADCCHEVVLQSQKASDCSMALQRNLCASNPCYCTC